MCSWYASPWSVRPPLRTSELRSVRWLTVRSPSPFVPSMPSLTIRRHIYGSTWLLTLLPRPFRPQLRTVWTWRDPCGWFSTETCCKMRSEPVQTFCRGSLAAGCGLVCWASWDALRWNRTFLKVQPPSVESLWDSLIMSCDWRLTLPEDILYSYNYASIQTALLKQLTESCWMSLFKGAHRSASVSN